MSAGVRYDFVTADIISEVPMFTRGPIVLVSALCALMSACGGSGRSPTPPSSPALPRHDGQWSGTTSQGRPITFTVSLDQKVTAISVGYSFNGCVGSSSFSDLNVSIVNISPTPPAGPDDYGFGYSSGQNQELNYTLITAFFNAKTTATGTVIFSGYAGCGNAAVIWSATRA